MFCFPLGRLHFSPCMHTHLSSLKLKVSPLWIHIQEHFTYPQKRLSPWCYFGPWTSFLKVSLVQNWWLHLLVNLSENLTDPFCRCPEGLYLSALCISLSITLFFPVFHRTFSKIISGGLLRQRFENTVISWVLDCSSLVWGSWVSAASSQLLSSGCSLKSSLKILTSKPNPPNFQC